MTERVPILVLVDDGYFGHESLHQELGPEFDVSFATGAIEAHEALTTLTCPLVLAPRTLDPIPGDLLLADLAAHRYDFVGALMLDDDAVDRIAPGIDLIVKRPLRPGILRLHMLAAAGLRARLLGERVRAARLDDDLARLRDGLRHDLRGQLQSVIGLASLVLELEKPRRAPEDELIDFMTRIGAAGDRLTRFVDALADWLNAARRPLEKVPVDLGELALEVVAKARTGYDPNVIQTSFVPPDPVALAARVTGDPRMLQKALETLVERALAASKTAHVRIERNDRGWTVGVSDVCPRPIPAQQCPRAFNLFERVGGGDGIGLALVKKVAERHDATVTLEALAGGGHEVVLQLPWIP